MRTPILELPFKRQVRYVDPNVGDPRAVETVGQIRRDFGLLVPPFRLHLPAPGVLAACWAILREPTCGALVERDTKEAVAAAVSASNTCPYCVDVHTTMLHALGGRKPAAAIASGALDDIADPDLRGVVEWARATRQPQAPILEQRPFPDDHAPELIGVAVAFHYINRMVNIFTVDSPFPVTAPKAKPVARRIGSPLFRTLLLRRKVTPGASLDLLPAAALPDDLEWAAPDPVIAAAFAGAAAAFDDAGRRALSSGVRELVSDRLHAWSGEAAGISRGWVESAVEPLPESQRPLGRLVLLVAFASHQVDTDVVDKARPRPGPAGDETLVAAAAWASFAAARRIGSWLHTETTSMPSPTSTSSRAQS